MTEMNNIRSVKKTRKNRACEWCGQRINAGDSCDYFSQVYEGDFHTFYMHTECTEAYHEGGFDEFMFGEQFRGKPYGFEE